jgi:phytoene synthase
VDDIADLGVERGADRGEQRRALDGWRRDVARCYEPGGAPTDPIAVRLAQAVRTFAIPRDALLAIIDGVAMDLDRVRFETAEDLYPYCYRVASAVGLCCIEIFGYTDRRARQYAIDLGTALQLTNIIRDVGADARGGRIYVPQDDLRKFGVTVEDLQTGRYTEQFVQLMRHQAERARQFYRAARESFPSVDARSLVPAEIMGRIYFALLQEIEARRFQVFGERVTVPTGRKVAIAFRCWAAARFGAVASPGGRAA